MGPRPGGIVGAGRVQEGRGRFPPGVHVGGDAPAAPGVDLGLGARVGGDEGGEVGGADHAVDEGDGVGDEDAVHGLGLAQRPGARLERRQVRLEGVEDVVREELGAVGADVEGSERG